MKTSKILPLRSLDVPARPLNHRALAWSSDAELAVAADDSVIIYIPEYPILDPAHPLKEDTPPPPPSHAAGDQQGARAPQEGEDGVAILPAGLPTEPGDEDPDDDDDDDGDEEEDESSSDEEEDGDDAADEVAPEPRCQFSEITRHFPVSYPFLHPDLNMHVWEAAGKDMPVIHSGVRDEPDHAYVSAVFEAIPETEAQGREQEQEQPVPDENRDQEPEEPEQQAPEENGRPAQPPVQEVVAHPGAGIGVIGAAGASMNHVVAVEWSPPGVGRNERPVLAVLTGVGSLAVYGEGAPFPFGSTARPSRILGRGRGAARDLQSWLVLWAVGENFVVPGQEEYGYGEFVKAFSWSGEIGGGRALLAYMNDVRELVVLCVGTTFRKREDGEGEAVWNVQEMLRMEAAGLHGELDRHDPDFVPSGSSYSLRWSPWVKSEDTWSCLLSYMDSNYIGFKRITINAPTWAPKDAPVITCDPQDWDSRCLHLGPDAFLEFESMIWDVNNKQVCRGIIATPWIAEPFEVDLSSRSRRTTAHPTERCNTSYSPDHTNNPITGLVIHPIPLSTVSPSLVPLYTAVRLSATATNTTWWETNAPRDEQPQWATEITQKITQTMPLGMAIQKGNFVDDDDPDLGRDPIEFFGEEEKGSDDDDDDDDEEIDEDANFNKWAKEGPDVHPFRMRVWGIAISPGGGTTAVLASSQLAVRLEKDIWAARQSRLAFESRERRARPKTALPAGPDAMEVDQENGREGELEDSVVNVEGLSTEARLWEWMYGGGPGVPGLTPLPNDTPEPVDDDDDDDDGNPRQEAQHARDAAATARRAHTRDIFRAFAATQTCVVCADETTRLVRTRPGADGMDAGGERLLDCFCENGHRVAICGASGLAIMEPGVSRCCGVCQSRSLDVGYLVDRVLLPAGREAEAEVVRRDVPTDVCPRCGGKYLD